MMVQAMRRLRIISNEFMLPLVVFFFVCTHWLHIGVEWGLHYPAANGECQSPINLNSREAQYDPSLLDVRLSSNYVVCRDCEVVNDGHTVRILLKSKSGMRAHTRTRHRNYRNAFFLNTYGAEKRYHHVEPDSFEFFFPPPCTMKWSLRFQC